MKVYALNVFLAENPPIKRTIKILENQTLKALHHTIIKAFHMVKASKVSLHSATDKYRKKDKLALAKLPNDEETVLMEDVTIGEFFDGQYQKLVYDCTTFRSWTFHIELLKIKDKKKVKASKYPDWNDPSGHGLNDYRKDIVLSDEEDDMESFIDEDSFGEALKDLDTDEEED